MLSGCRPGADGLPKPTVRPVQGNYQPLPAWPQTGPADHSQTPAGPTAWTPTAGADDHDRWRGILIHHSATPDGNAAELNRLHQIRTDQNGERWLGLGYDFVIDNGRGGPDGGVEVGFRWTQQLQGAHCRPLNCTDNYWNEHTIGICLVGDFERHRPTRAQYESLATLVKFLCRRYGIPEKNILGHGQVPNANTKCPGRYFSWSELRRRL